MGGRLSPYKDTNMKTKRHAVVDKDKVLRNMLSSNKFGVYFGVSQDVQDRVWASLTSPEGRSVIYISMEIGADYDVFYPVKKKLQEFKITGSKDQELDFFIKKYSSGPAKIPNYGGGLGILAGDTLKSFADNKIPAIAISLLYKKGYFSQLVDSKLGQIAWTKEWEPENTPSLYLLKNPDDPEVPLEISIPFYDRRDRRINATAQLWLKMEVNEDLDFFVPEILLDYSIPSTPEWIRESAQHLYDSSSERAKAIQRRLLGSSITSVIKALGLSAQTLHLNEQHGVVVVLHLISEKLYAKFGPDYIMIAKDKDIIEAANAVAEQVVYTIHTPVKAGHDRFNSDMYADLGHSFCQRILYLLAKDDEYPDYFNFTSLAMKVNRATNSVSRLHKEVTKKQFPQYADKITAITNGVHHLTWVSDNKAELYNSFDELKGWQKDPSAFTNAARLINNKKFRKYLEQAWFADTQKLTDYANDMLILHRNQMQETWIDPPNFLSHLPEKEARFDPNIFTIGFARRFSTYKRADLIFEDLDALCGILLQNNRPVNFIFAGKAHPADEQGKLLIKHILDTQEALYEKSKGLAKLIFIPGYDMAIAKVMVSGAHAWLNSPKRPLEASGTSGMKVVMNAIPNISIMDGWWVEGYHDGKTGWKFGYENPVNELSLSEDHSALLYAEDSASFYKVFPEILETFYDPLLRDQYIDKCIMNLALNCPVFNTHRMIAEYVDRYNLTLPAAVDKAMVKFRKLYCSDS